MKSLFFLMFATFSLSLAAAKANLFSCEGGGATLSFAGSIIGQPSLIGFTRGDSALNIMGSKSISMVEEGDGTRVLARGKDGQVSFLIPKSDRSFSTEILWTPTNKPAEKILVSCVGELVYF
jgi:hypothetical protein